MTELDQRPPAGWYADTYGAMRWWDGDGWTEHVQPSEAAPSSVASGSLAAEPAAPVEPVPTPVAASVEAALPPQPVGAAHEPEPEPAAADPGGGESYERSRHVMPRDDDGRPRRLPPRTEGAVMLVIAVPLLVWGSLHLLGFVLRGFGQLSPIVTPLALLAVIAGVAVGRIGLHVVTSGDTADLPDWLVGLSARIGDTRRLLTLGAAVVAVVAVIGAGLWWLGQRGDEPVAPPSDVGAVTAVPLPAGFSAAGPGLGYLLLPAAKSSCAKGTSCRVLQVVALAPCSSVTALVQFRDQFKGGIGTSLVGAQNLETGKPVALKASIKDPAGRFAEVMSVRCSDT